MCCDFTPGLNFTCLENGMCAGPEDSDSKRRVMVRGGCTDPTWKDEECRKICMWGGKFTSFVDCSGVGFDGAKK